MFWSFWDDTLRTCIRPYVSKCTSHMKEPERKRIHLLISNVVVFVAKEEFAFNVYETHEEEWYPSCQWRKDIGRIDRDSLKSGDRMKTFFMWTRKRKFLY
ncbi:hypothetical protein DPMN_065003 [Dreissena polymorpha]|uniref:Uncharacterized protein n=1 Tax=Dreissena polymorpha TaxID=45954 RepID=A0A9D4CEW7_DREPO|nr:hypothetical protein DPMN_065003 [Dreissena polymorpha]